MADVDAAPAHIVEALRRMQGLLEDAAAEFAAMKPKAQAKHRRAFMSKIAVYEFAVEGVRAACGLATSAPASTA